VRVAGQGLEAEGFPKAAAGQDVRDDVQPSPAVASLWAFKLKASRRQKYGGEGRDGRRHGKPRATMCSGCKADGKGWREIGRAQNSARVRAGSPRPGKGRG